MFKNYLQYLCRKQGRSNFWKASRVTRQSSPVVKSYSEGQMLYEEGMLQTGKKSAQLSDGIGVVLPRGTISLFSKLERLE